MNHAQTLTPTVEKPEFLRELGPVDISSIKNLILNIPEKLWEVEDAHKENKFDCFHHTHHIVFRFITANRDHRDSYSTPLWQMWQRLLLPLMHEVIKPYGYSRPVFPKAMLARLAAGYEIDRHVDGAGSNLHTHKIHIPIQTNEKVKFHLGPHSFHLREGFAYEVNNIVRHGVENFGDEDRIHFIFECYDEDGPV